MCIFIVSCHIQLLLRESNTFILFDEAHSHLADRSNSLHYRHHLSAWAQCMLEGQVQRSRSQNIEIFEQK